MVGNRYAIIAALLVASVASAQMKTGGKIKWGGQISLNDNGFVPPPPPPIMGFSMSTTSSSTNPNPFPQVNRSCCNEHWSSLETARGTYAFGTYPTVTAGNVLDKWITQANNNGVAELYTFLYVPTWASTFSLSASTIVGNGTNATVTTSKTLPGSWYAGKPIAISGASIAGYNDSSSTIVSITGSNTFTYANTTTGTATGATAKNISNATGDEPNDIYGSGTVLGNAVAVACQNVLTGTTTTDCQYKEFVTAFMQHVCSVSSQPGTPLIGKCSVHLFEMWNEINVTRYWTSPYADLAQMFFDASAIIRAYCGDCKIGGGSTSAGGDGFNPSGGSSRYDLALNQVLYAWSQIPGFVPPDFITFHSYGSRTTVQPSPFPFTIISNSDPLCTSSTPSASCRTAINDQPGVVANSVLGGTVTTGGFQDISAWAANLPIWSTEGGYGLNAQLADVQNGSISGNGTTATFTSRTPLPFDWTSGTVITMQGASPTGFNSSSLTITKTGTSTFTFPSATSGSSSSGEAINHSTTQTWFLRAAYVSQWMIALAQPGLMSQAMAYAYNEQCWMTFYGTNSNSGCTADPAIPTGYTASRGAFVQTQAWINGITSWGGLNSSGSPATHWINVTYNGAPGQLVWYDGWLSSNTSYNTGSFTHVQHLDGSTSSVSGTTTISQQPYILY